MDTKRNPEPDDREYQAPELIVHGDLARLTSGLDPGSADIASQGSALAGDGNPQ